MLVTLGSLSELCEGLAVPPLPLNIEGGRAKEEEEEDHISHFLSLMQVTYHRATS